MADFIGTTVLVVLKDALHSQLQGRITNVVAGQGDSELVLEDVYFLGTNQYLPHFRVGGSSVADISIVSQPSQQQQQQQQAQRAPAQQAQFPPPQLAPAFQDPAIISAPSSYQNPAGPPPPYGYPQQYGQPSAQQVQQKQKPRAPPVAPVFDDPAIVSMSKPPTKESAGSSQHVPSPQPTQHTFATTPTRSPASLSMPPPKMAPIASNTTRARPSMDSGKARKTSTRTEQTMKAFSSLNLENDGGIESSAVEETDNDFTFSPMPVRNETRKFLQQRRIQRGKAVAGVRSRNLAGSAAHDGDMAGSTVIRPGMFAGPIAQAALANTHTPPRRNHRRRQLRHQRGSRYDNGTADEEGWATEDVNEYNQTEFDFQGNLDRFDKKTVFSQIRAEDTVAESDRLVSFNRLPNRNKSSTQPAPQKNFLHSENVLGQYANGKISLSERAGWDAPDQNLEESDETDTDSDVPTGSGNAADSGRSSRRTLSRQSLTRMGRTLSNNMIGRGGSSENLPALAKPSKVSLRLGTTNRACPIVTPLQMLDVERIAEVELGLNDDMMTENAARAIAQVAIQAFGKRISVSNFNALPVVLAMVGNTKSGARVIAAARHLKNHSVRVMVISVGLEREDELLASVKKQLAIFRNSGGTVGRWEEMQPKIAGLDSPAELIIDGLLGIHKDFDDLRTEDQATTYELVQFANKSKAAVLSVDVPSGVDGNTGEVADIQDTGPFHVRATIVVALGAPKMGLLNACKSGIGHNWKLYVADIGISNTAWRKYGTRRRHGVEFASDWVVPLHYSQGRSE